MLVCFLLFFVEFCFNCVLEKVFGVIDPLIYSEKMFTPEEVQLKSIMQDFATIRGTRLKVFAKSADFGKRGDLI